MPADPTALAAEIAADPASLGYAPLVAAGNDAGLAALLNATTGPGAATVTVPSMTRDEFLTACLPGVAALAGLSATIQAKWDRLLSVACSANTVSTTTAGAILGMAVADGVLTSGQAAVVGKRTGSRAEVLWGAGTVVGLGDVSFALRGARGA